jgi:hypothetical protein
MFGKSLLTIAVIIGCGSGVAGSRRVVSPSQQARLVAIDWRIHLDDATNFDFTRLTVSIQRRAGKYHPWIVVGSFVPDKTGRFTASVPAGSWVSIDVTTSDATVQRANNARDDVEFYELEAKKSESIMLEEFNVAGDSVERIERTLNFHRGAAFSVCVPNGLKRGSLLFYDKSTRSRDAISVWWFADSDSIRHSTVGGLHAGRWMVYYIGDDDAIFRSEELALRRGEVLRPKCGE